jgi:colicin import membrane protein
MRWRIGVSLVFASALGLAVSVRGDTVVMKSGQTLEGQILSENDKSIELEVEDAKAEHAIMRVPRSRILRIEEDTPEKLAEREAKKQEQRDLADQKKEEGFVLYNGKWVTEEDKAAAEKKAAEAKKKREKERAAAKQKAQAEAQRKEQEAKKQEQQWQQQQAQNQNVNPFNQRDRWMQMQNSWRDQNLNSPYGNQSYGNQSRRGSNYNSNSYGGYSPYGNGSGLMSNFTNQRY